jgi:putative membrane protein
MKYGWATLALALAVATPTVAGQKPGDIGTDDYVPEPDKTFMIQAAQGGRAEIELGQLAEQRGSDPEVKQFGEQMVTEHVKVNEQLHRIAFIKDVTLPTTPAKKDKELRIRLVSLSGDAFDRACMKAIVADYIEDLQAFRTESTSGHDPDLQILATEILPVIEQHLQRAQAAHRVAVTHSTRGEGERRPDTAYDRPGR